MTRTSCWSLQGCCHICHTFVALTLCHSSGPARGFMHAMMMAEQGAVKPLMLVIHPAWHTSSDANAWQGYVITGAALPLRASSWCAAPRQ